MRISAKALVNYSDVNHYSSSTQWTIRAGDPNTLYFQLIDLDQPTCDGGLRYIAGTCNVNQPPTLTVTFPSNAAALNTFNQDTNGGFIPFGTTLTFPVVDPSQVFTVTATQASPSDASIWKVVLAPTQVPNSGNVQFALTECGNTRRFFVTNMIDVEQLDNGSC